jgi:hypothetical protein
MTLKDGEKQGRMNEKNENVIPNSNRVDASNGHMAFSSS